MWGRAYTRETARPRCSQSRRWRASDTVGMVTTLCMRARKKASVWKAVEPIMAEEQLAPSCYGRMAYIILYSVW